MFIDDHAVGVDRMTLAEHVQPGQSWQNSSHSNMKNLSVKPLGLLVCGAFLIGPGTSLEAEERRFRLRIPNPLPRIVDRIEKVGDFVGRTARKIGGNDDEEKRDPSVPTKPAAVRPPKEKSDFVRRSDPGKLELDPDVAMRGESKRPSKERSPVTSESPRPSGDVPGSDAGEPQSPPSKKEGVSPSANGVTQKRDHETASPAADTAVSSPVASGASADGPSADVADASPLAALPVPKGPTFGLPVPGSPGLVYPPGAAKTPENRVDVRGIPPGTKVRDPATGNIFLVP
jgi:hypothetical protein